MKASITKNASQLNTAVLLIFLLVGSLIASTINSNSIFRYEDENTSRLILPDSIPLDTTEEAYISGDTIDILSDGGDSIFVLYTDTTASGDTIPDSMALRTFDVTKDIAINLQGYTEQVNGGLFGFTLEGAFLNGHIPEDDPDNPDAWTWLSNLQPRTLRFPGGANGKFMHLRPYIDRDADGTLDPVFGYGYDLDEIIRYYDITNETDDPDDIIDNIQADEPAYLSSIKTDLTSDGDCDYCHEWMDAVKYQKDLEGYYGKWATQDEIPFPVTDPRHEYINQFIDLVNEIETAHGYKIDVILDLNILSESAAQCKAIVKYMRDHTKNGVTDVNVVGVEIGNECYLNWGADLMGFDVFGDYWNYINGGNSALTADERNYIFGDLPVKTSHNYINQFKGDIDFNCKVGIPADNPQNTETITYMFREGAEKGYPITTGWNSSLANPVIYGSTITAGTETRYKFDAVILHTYYDATHNYKQIPLDNLCLFYPSDGFPSCNLAEGCPTGSNWQYGTYDSRLVAAYSGILGTTLAPPFGNFKTALKTRYLEYYDKQKAVLKFSPSNPYPKELWNTEWNLKDKVNSNEISDEEQDLISIYNNSFPHGLITQELVLKNIKLNYTLGYIPSFFTYSTFHNFAGGGWTDMLCIADCADCKNHINDDGSPNPLNPALYTGDVNYYMRRTEYYVMELLSEITKNNLQYLPANFSMYFTNPNLQPTVFIDPEHENLYVYFTNMKAETQSYAVNPNHLMDLYPTAVSLGFEDATIYTIQANQPYSNSGLSTLFKIHTCYSCHNLFDGLDNPHPFEIQRISDPIPNDPECSDGLPAGAMCITVPKYSIGYFKIPIHVNYDPQQKTGVEDLSQFVTLYPNPTSGVFQIRSEISGLFSDAQLRVTVYSVTDKVVFETKAAENQPIDLSHLPSGLYLVAIKDETDLTISKQLIKIE